jgi:hypothetical protein
MKPCVSAIQALTGHDCRMAVNDCRLWQSSHSEAATRQPANVATVPPGGWLGSGADEGRAKLR